MTIQPPIDPRQRPAAAWWIVADLLDKAEPTWGQRPPPSTESTGRDHFYEIEVTGRDATPTRWVLWPDQAQAIAPSLKRHPNAKTVEVQRR